MRTRILAYLRTQHLGLIALILVIAGGSAYAAGLAKNSVKSKQIKNGQVKSVDVKDQGLTGTDIADGSVGSPEIADGSIAAAEIQDGAVGSPEIGTDAVTAAELANDAVIGQKIATGVIGGGKLSPGAVSTNKIEDGAVNTAKVADGSLTQADMDPNSVADVVSRSGTIAADAALHPVLALDGFGTLQISCDLAGGGSIGVRYEFASGVTQDVTLVVRGVSGVATVTRSSATLANVPPVSTDLVDGYVLIDAGSRVARLDYAASIAAGECPHFERATIDRNEP